MSKDRGEPQHRSFRRPAALAILAALLLLLPLFGLGGPYFMHICILMLTYVIATSSLRTVFISGQSSVGHAAFMGIGAYASAIMALRLGWTPWLTMLIGAAGAALVAALAGYLFSRLRALYFSMVTLFFGVAVEALMRSWPSLTGGRSGLVGYPGLGALSIPGLGEIDFGASKVPYYYLLLVLAFVTLFILYRIERSRTGMNWMAIAQSPLVASSIGINETKYRVLAFTVGCFFAGLAGGVYAHYNGVLSSSSFGLMSSINLVTYMLLGGMSYFAGPIIGVVVLVAIPEIFRSFKEYAPFIYGGVMLVVIFFMPQGLAGLFRPLSAWAPKVFGKGTL
jgi:branched-chain amino acid transport system permease protein